jgi:hypothetical protein
MSANAVYKRAGFSVYKLADPCLFEWAKPSCLQLDRPLSVRVGRDHLVYEWVNPQWTPRCTSGVTPLGKKNNLRIFSADIRYGILDGTFLLSLKC